MAFDPGFAVGVLAGGSRFGAFSHGKVQIARSGRPETAIVGRLYPFAERPKPAFRATRPRRMA